MIKLEEYKISGYKNILEADLSFENVNVIIGSNNSGKSNFIQSISFINFIINVASTDDLEKYFEVGFKNTYFKKLLPTNVSLWDVPVEHTLSFSLKFSNSKTNRVFNYYLELQATENLFENKYSIKAESLDAKESNKPGQAINIFNRKWNNVKFGSKLTKTSLFQEVPEHLSVIRILKLILSSDNETYIDAVDSLNSVIKTPTFYFSNIELLKTENVDRLDLHNGRIVSFELKDEVIKLEKTDKWEIFKSALENILNIENVTVGRYSFGNDESSKKITYVLSFTHFKKEKNLTDFSDGTVLIIALITKILSSSNDIFLIEEPENSTHPRALIDLFSFLKSFSEYKQFIITSHSIAILNKTKTDNIIVSSVNEKGMSTFYNISSRTDLKKRLKQGHINFSDELFFGNLEEEEFE
ncbi:AAA family ATPase [Tenacibaculum aiptasiae]|uniref:AAA family ATPase n=1 Tax=Tenacibaculum aiptasiae TaxID=426481 RepID=UPI00232BC28D|nr:ATP-binding protein [Tenacibaculum aiptasiae]